MIGFDKAKRGGLKRPPRFLLGKQLFYPIPKRHIL